MLLRSELRSVGARFAQRRPLGELHARARGRATLAGGGLDRVDRLPALPRHHVRRARLDEALDVVGDRLVHAAGGHVLDDLVDGVQGILLVRSDHARRAALDPAGHVLAELVRAVGIGHATALVADQAAPLVERDVVDRLPRVADRAEHELRRELVERPGAARDQRAVVARHDRVVLDPHGAHVAVLVAEQLDRRGEEAEADGDRLSGLRPRLVLTAGSRRSAAGSCRPRRARPPTARPARRRRSRRHRARARPSRAARDS